MYRHRMPTLSRRWDRPVASHGPQNKGQARMHAHPLTYPPNTPCTPLHSANPTIQQGSRRQVSPLCMTCNLQARAHNVCGPTHSQLRDAQRPPRTVPRSTQSRETVCSQFSICVPATDAHAPPTLGQPNPAPEPTHISVCTHPWAAVETLPLHGADRLALACLPHAENRHTH
jgi:hypothetical protein